MSCRIFRWLCRLVPVPAWQKFLVRFHLGRCPACAHEFELEKTMADIINCPDQSVEAVDLWPAVSRGIATEPATSWPWSSPDPSRSRWRFRWAWLVAALLLIGVTALVTTRHALRPPSGPSGAEPQPPVARAVMQSATINGRPAAVFYFQSQNPDRLIVWIQKT